MGDAALYGQLIVDRRICHGAFRLWHYLRDRADKTSWVAWPSQRTIAEAIGCKEESLPGWTSELLKAGYLLKVEQRGQRHVNEYFLAPPQEGVRNNSRTPPKGFLAPPKKGEPRTPHWGGVSNNSTQEQGTKGPRERWMIERDSKSVREQIERLSRDTGCWVDQHGVKHPNDKPRPEAKARIEKLKVKLGHLQSELDDAD